MDPTYQASTITYQSKMEEDTVYKRWSESYKGGSDSCSRFSFCDRITRIRILLDNPCQLMTTSSLHLNEWCLSRLPDIQADPSLTRENASNRWAVPIVVLTNVSYCLREDLKILVDTAPHQNEG
jgi:hypothetical protein